ncbi:MAG TPA: imidazolonepropionase [Anaerovoracaceae bacterium]|nr:imidazolonepropionase [Anaerovoracaceae bacterium]
MKADLMIRSDYIFTCSEKKDREIVNGYIAAANGRITAVGDGEAPRDWFGNGTRYIDARGKTVTPGLIDAHTHLIHGGSREKELSLKLRGVPYLEILKMGGGILSTVESTRATSKDELKRKARKSLKQMLLHGTTTIEAKSGYGLDLETEVKCLQAAAELDREGEIDIVSTYMGAHAVPEEYKRDKQGYIDFMISRAMPYVAENRLAEFMDVFCEEGVFSPEESRKLMQAGKELGFKLKIHADEIVPLQGAELAAEMGALSAEHLLAASEEGMDAMSRANTTAVLLPGTSFYLMTGKYAQARRMMEKGIRVAIATDYNPGSCPTENLQAVMLFACLGMKLLPEEIIKCMTINAAYAIDRAAETGSIEIGKKADIVIFDTPNLDYLIYHFGINHAETVVKNGKVAVENGNLAKESGYGIID